MGRIVPTLFANVFRRDVGQRRALRRTRGPPPARRRETPAQREALPHTPTGVLNPGPRKNGRPKAAVPAPV